MKAYFKCPECKALQVKSVERELKKEDALRCEDCGEKILIKKVKIKYGKTESDPRLWARAY